MVLVVSLPRGATPAAPVSDDVANSPDYVAMAAATVTRKVRGSLPSPYCVLSVGPDVRDATTRLTPPLCPPRPTLPQNSPPLLVSDPHPPHAPSVTTPHDYDPH
jgi:hypothetical protein